MTMFWIGLVAGWGLSGLGTTLLLALFHANHFDEAEWRGQRK